MSTTRKMPYVRLGGSGLKISKIILGTMQYGDPSWQDWVKGEEEACEHIKAAYDAGIQTFDTADVYSNGYSEVILGKAIKKWNLPRDEIVVMTKVFFTVARTYGENLLTSGKNTDTLGYVNQQGLSRKHIFDAVKNSLKRLQLDYIDVLQCHRFDPNTPVEETMQALHDVVKAGYVRYIGMSSCFAYQFHIMQNYAISHNLTPFISMQNHYSMIYREEEREMFPTLKHFNVGAIPWSPLARGLLTRPLSERTKRGDTDWFIQNVGKDAGVEDIINRVEEIANKKGVSMAQVSLAWVMSKEGVSAPIVGTTSVKNLHDLIGTSLSDHPVLGSGLTGAGMAEGVNVKLTEEEIKYLEEPYRPRAIVGHA